MVGAEWPVRLSCDADSRLHPTDEYKDESLSHDSGLIDTFNNSVFVLTESVFSKPHRCLQQLIL